MNKKHSQEKSTFKSSFYKSDVFEEMLHTEPLRDSQLDIIERFAGVHSQIDSKSLSNPQLLKTPSDKGKHDETETNSEIPSPKAKADSYREHSQVIINKGRVFEEEEEEDATEAKKNGTITILEDSSSSDTEKSLYKAVKKLEEINTKSRVPMIKLHEANPIININGENDLPGTAFSTKNTNLQGAIKTPSPSSLLKKSLDLNYKAQLKQQNRAHPLLPLKKSLEIDSSKASIISSHRTPNNRLPSISARSSKTQLPAHRFKNTSSNALLSFNPPISKRADSLLPHTKPPPLTSDADSTPITHNKNRRNTTFSVCLRKSRLGSYTQHDFTNEDNINYNTNTLTFQNINNNTNITRLDLLHNTLVNNNTDGGNVVIGSRRGSHRGSVRGSIMDIRLTDGNVFQRDILRRRYTSKGISLGRLDSMRSLDFPERVNTRNFDSARRKRCCASCDKYLVSCGSSFKIKWDIFVMFLVLYNTFSVPFDAAFGEVQTSSVVFTSFNLLVDFLFFSDVAINFRTTYIDKDGEEIKKGVNIAKSYVKSGKFYIDFLASIPYDRVGILYSSSNISFGLLSLLKLVRLLRWNKLLRLVKWNSQFKISFRIVMLFLLFVITVHMTTCVWHYVVRQSEDWIPPKDLARSEITDLYESDIGRQYGIQLYYSIALLFGTEVAPSTTLEVYFASLFLLIGSILTAIIFSNMTVLFQSLNYKSSKFQEICDDANTAMENIHLPEKLVSNINKFLYSTYTNLDRQEELDKFFSLLSPNLKYEVVIHLYKDLLLKDSTLIRGLDEMIIERLVKVFKTVVFLPEDEIITQYDYSDRMYFIGKGEVDVLIFNARNEYVYVRSLKSGSYFGEIGLITNVKRTATVKATKYSTTAMLSAKQFKAICDEFPALYRRFLAQMQTYDDEYTLFLRKSLTVIPFLNALSSCEFIEILYNLKKIQVQAGEELIEIGAEPEYAFLVYSGQLHVQVKYTKGKTLLADARVTSSFSSISPIEKSNCVFYKLQKGWVGFAYSFLDPTPQSFSIVAVEDSNIILIPKKLILEIGNNNKVFMGKVHEVIQLQKDKKYFFKKDFAVAKQFMKREGILDSPLDRDRQNKTQKNIEKVRAFTMLTMNILFNKKKKLPKFLAILNQLKNQKKSSIVNPISYLIHIPNFARSPKNKKKAENVRRQTIKNNAFTSPFSDGGKKLIMSAAPVLEIEGISEQTDEDSDDMKMSEKSINTRFMAVSNMPEFSPRNSSGSEEDYQILPRDIKLLQKIVNKITKGVKKRKKNDTSRKGSLTSRLPHNTSTASFEFKKNNPE